MHRVIEWHPAKSKHQPFRLVQDYNNQPIRYRGKIVCSYLGKYYIIQQWHYNFHPASYNCARLIPATKKCLQWLNQQDWQLEQVV